MKEQQANEGKHIEVQAGIEGDHEGKGLFFLILAVVEDFVEELVVYEAAQVAELEEKQRDLQSAELLPEVVVGA